MLRRSKKALKQTVQQPNIELPYVGAEYISMETIQGKPTKNFAGQEIMIGALTGGIDDTAVFRWIGALPAFELVAHNGYSGYAFEDGDYGIDGYLATQHPLTREAEAAISKSARSWGIQNGNSDFAHTWINRHFGATEAELMHHLVMSRFLGLEPLRFSTNTEYGGANFSNDWGSFLVPPK